MLDYWAIKELASLETYSTYLKVQLALYFKQSNLYLNNDVKDHTTLL